MKNYCFIRLFALFLIFAMLLTVTSCSGVSTTSNNVSTTKSVFNGAITLGVVCPLTGTSQLDGEYYIDGIKMAVAEINAKGGILGKELKVSIQDEGNDQAMSLSATQKLISDNVAAIIGSWYSTNCMAVLPTVLQSKMIYFANGSNPNIFAQKNPWVWQIRVTDNFTGPIMSDVAVKTLKMKNPAVFYTTAASTTLQAESFIAAMKSKQGITIPSKNVYGAAETEINFSTIINQILASDVDGLVCMGVSTAWSIPFAQQLFNAGGNELPRLGSNSFSSTAFIQMVGDAGNGWNTVNDWSPSFPEVADKFNAPKEALDFERKYRTIYGEKTASQSAWGYDCVYLFYNACIAAGTTDDRAAINKALELTNYQGTNNYYKYYEDTFHVLSSYIMVSETIKGLSLPWDSVNYRK